MHLYKQHEWPKAATRVICPVKKVPITATPNTRSGEPGPIIQLPVVAPDERRWPGYEKRDWNEKANSALEIRRAESQACWAVHGEKRRRPTPFEGERRKQEFQNEGFLHACTSSMNSHYNFIYSGKTHIMKNSIQCTYFLHWHHSSVYKRESVTFIQDNPSWGNRGLFTK